jgi:hypothetical protein
MRAGGLGITPAPRPARAARLRRPSFARPHAPPSWGQLHRLEGGGPPGARARPARRAVPPRGGAAASDGGAGRGGGPAARGGRLAGRCAPPGPAGAGGGRQVCGRRARTPLPARGRARCASRRHPAGAVSEASAAAAAARLMARLRAAGYTCGWQIVWGDTPGGWPPDWYAREPGLVGDAPAAAAPATGGGGGGRREAAVVEEPAPPGQTVFQASVPPPRECAHRLDAPRAPSRPALGPDRPRRHAAAAAGRGPVPRPAAPQVKLLQPADISGSVALRQEDDGFWGRHASALLAALLAAGGWRAECSEYFYQARAVVRERLWGAARRRVAPRLAFMSASGSASGKGPSPGAREERRRGAGRGPLGRLACPEPGLP